MTKWYQKASVQSAFVGGAFLLFAALVSGIFIVLSGEESKDERSKAEAQILDLRDHANWVKGVYEKVGQSARNGDHSAAIVRERAPFVAKQFLGVADRNLSEGYIIIKYCFSGMLFVLAGQLESNRQAALENVGNAEKALDSCKAEIDRVEAGAGNGDEQHHEILSWIGSNSYKDWWAYNTAIARSLDARLGGNVTWFEIEQALDQISPPYLERDPITDNLALLWSCTHLAQGKDEGYCKGG